MRVLIAEDDRIYRFLLEKVIQERGHTLLMCSDGAEALSILTGNDPPEIAILDWMMPKMDGPEVCQKVREIFPAVPVYIILLTGRTHPEDVIAGLSAGADDYITKPFNKQDLLTRVQVGVRVANLQCSLADRVQDLEVVLTRLREMQQAQKLDALGQMASGIAHEINTPTQYISENIKFVQKSWNDAGPFLQRAEEDPEIAYLIQEVPKALAESLQGVEKIGQFVRAMRDFCRSSGSEKVIVDINQAVRTTLTVATNEWKYDADVAMDLDPELPPLLGLPGEIHQVLLTLIVNGAHAISDVRKTSIEKGLLRIATSVQDGWIEIAVSDTGAGIPEEYRDKVFEPFFTTKALGKGNGQGLATAYSVVVQQHSGRIWFETKPGKGTTFFVRLPLNGTGEEAHERDKANSAC